MGITFGSLSVLGPRAITEIARKAQDMGYKSIWTVEATGTDALTMLGAAGQAAPKLDLGSGIIPVQGDYTNEDEEITKWLKKYNRPGVPMYLIIPAGKPDGVITLPDLLTKSSILEGLKRSGGSNDCG